MDYILDYHRRIQVFRYIKNESLTELLVAIRNASYPPDSTRKTNPPKHKTSGIRTFIKHSFDEVILKNWLHDVNLFDTSKVPASKLHYCNNRIGVIRTLAHRSTMGTDILRLELAARSLDIIDLGVIVCSTKNFEQYYLGTEQRKGEMIVVFEDLIDYLRMIEDLITVPILIIGLNPPQ